MARSKIPSFGQNLVWFKTFSTRWDKIWAALQLRIILRKLRVGSSKTKQVNPPIDSQVLLLHGMPEKSVILHEEITSSRADTESVVVSARIHIALSINLHVPLIKNCCGKGRGESGWSSGTACCRKSGRKWWRCGKRQTCFPCSS